MQVASLVVSMAADVSRLKTDMERARKTVEGATGQMAKAADRAKKALGAIGAALITGAAVKGLTSFIKQAVDAADEMSKLSQKTGVAMKDVAGLQLAFKQSGLQAGAFQQSMTKLSQAMTDGNKAFQTLGLSATKTDGTLKTTRQMLGDVADRFAGMEDGARKTALAVQIFGRAGADMIPLLNGGAASLDSFDETARKLGLTLDDGVGPKAEQFNDTMSLIGMASKGIGRQIMTELLPTMNNLAGTFFESMTEGDRLKKITDALAIAFKVLANIVQVVVQTILNAITLLRALFDFAKTNVLALVGAIRQALSGDISGAFNTLQSGAQKSFGIISDTTKEYVDSTKKLYGDMADVWTGANADKTADLAKNLGAQRRLQEEAARRNEELQKRQIGQTRQRADAQNLLNKELDEYFKQEEKARQETEKSIRSAREMVEAIEFETKALKMTNTEREVAIKLRELERNGIRKGSREYEEFAARIREAVVGRETVRASIEVQNKIRANWERTWDQVAQSMTDALINGGIKVKDLLRNMFKTLVLRPIIDPIMRGMTGMISGAVGSMFPGMASAGEIGGSTMNMMTMARSAYQAISGGFASLGNSVAFAADTMGSWLVNNTAGVLNKMGGSLMQSAGTLGTAASYLGGAAAGLALGNVISGQYAAFGNANVSTVAGTAIGAIFGGPIGAAIGGAIGGVVNRAFGRGPKKVRDMGITGTFGTSGADVQQFEDWKQKGGWFRSSKSGTKLSGINNELDQFLSGSLVQITQATRSYAQILGLNADAVNGVTQSVKISLKGLTPEKQEEAISQALGGFGDRLAQNLLGEFRSYEVIIGKGRKSRAETRTEWIAGPFVRAGETAGEALSRLATSLATANQVFDTLGQTLFATSLKGGDAASKLIDAFGGVENFVQGTTAYYQQFYTEAERAETATRQLTDVLGSMGLKMPDSLASFRAMVEAQDLMTDSGRQTYAALINLAPAFAQVQESSRKLAEEELKRQAELNQKALQIAQERQSLEVQLLQLQGNTAELRRRELAALDPANRALQKQIWALQDAKTAEDDRRQAMERATSSMIDEIQRLRGLQRDQSASALQSQFAILTAQARAGDMGAMERLPEISRALEQATILQAKTAVDVARMRGTLAASLEQTLERVGVKVPQFAVGTNYVPQDMLAMVHKGEAIVPKAYNPSADNTGNEKLISEVSALRAEVRAVVTHTSKTAKILDRVSPDGNTLAVSTQ